MAQTLHLVNSQKIKAKAKDDKVGSAFFKLINSGFYVKTIEEIYNRQYVQIVIDVYRYIK